MRPLSPVQESDSLCKIADRIYGDGQFWTQIYEGNREDVGKDASLLTAGTDLEMTVNASQADYAAMRRGGLVGGGLGVENGSGYPPPILVIPTCYLSLSRRSRCRHIPAI